MAQRSVVEASTSSELAVGEDGTGTSGRARVSCRFSFWLARRYAARRALCRAPTTARAAVRPLDLRDCAVAGRRGAPSR